MTRLIFEVALFIAVWVVAIEKIRREWVWLAENGSLDYFLIVGVGAAFVAFVFLADRLLEESGLVVHHWWED
jgi:hypothetical protein